MSPGRALAERRRARGSPLSDCRIMQAGQTIAVRVRGARPDGSAHRHGAVAAFWGPGRDPRRDPGDRVPDRTAVLAFDPVTRTYGAEVRTAGWRPGTWTVRGIVLGPDGVPEGWDWYRFPLEA
jgi:hypothetical protein